MNKTNTTTTDRILGLATVLPEGAFKMTTFNIAETFANDQGEMGATLRANVLAFQANPDLISFYAGFTNLVELSGGSTPDQEDAAAARVLKMLGTGAVIINRKDGAEDLRTVRCALCSAKYLAAETDYTATEFGPVVRLKVRPENLPGPEQVLYLNMFNYYHFEFLSSLYAFPILFWATVCGGNVHVTVYRATQLTKAIEDNMKRARRCPIEGRDFAKAVAICEAG